MREASAPDSLREAIAPDSLREAIAPDSLGGCQQWLSAMAVSSGASTSCLAPPAAPWKKKGILWGLPAPRQGPYTDRFF